MKIKYPAERGPRWGFMQWMDIPSKVNEGEVYLRRLRIIQTPLFRLFLHFIYEKDTDRDMHNHPWTFFSLILRGGYSEKVLTPAGIKVNTRNRLSLHRMPLSNAHKIVSIKQNTVTLIATGPKRQDWGFLTDNGFVPWEGYV